MVITKLVLFKYKRLFLSNIETITYTPMNNIQVILGGNGQGKSSLLFMLTPIPPNLKKEFNEGGYKIIEIEHNSKNYVLLSGGDLGNKHSFVCDGKEMNHGGTKQVQLELVKEHFSITPYSQSIILGTTKFTTMSPAERKKMFSDISHIDYSYPLRVFMLLKQRHRDIVGGIKILQENIIKIEANVVNEEELSTVRNNLTNLSMYIEHIISLYKHNINRDISIEELYSKLENINKELSKIYSSSNNLQTVNIDTIRSKIQTLDSEISLYKDMIDGIKNKLGNINIKPLKSVYELTKDIEALQKELDSVNIKYTNTKLEQVPVLLDTLNDSYIEVVDILNELNDYRDLTMSNEELFVFKEKLDNDKERINIKSNILKTLKIEIDHLIKHKNEENIVVCSKCDNSWYLNYDENSYLTLVDKRDKLEIELDNLVNKSNKDNELYGRYLERVAVVNRFKHHTVAVPMLRPIWVYILEGLSNSEKQNSVVIVNKLNTVKQDLQYLFEMYSKDLVLKELKIELENAIVINKIVEENNLKNIEELEISLSNYVKVVYSKELEKNNYTKLIQDLNNIEKLHYELRATLKSIYKTLDVSIDQLRNKHLTELTSMLKQHQVELEQKLLVNSTFINKIETSKSEIEELTNKEKVLKLLVKELSPSEGLIAKSINSFLNNFIRDMNSIISKVWSYDIEILPSEISNSNDLDYTFTVRVNGDEIIEDVSLLSSSMQEIVDLAFKIVYIKYTRINNVPLILDEFARTFDKNHRIKAYEIIETLFASHFRQIFMVSHFESIYGRFINSDINIIGDQSMYGEIEQVNEILHISYFKE